jgi:uncharacterized protein
MGRYISIPGIVAIMLVRPSMASAFVVPSLQMLGNSMIGIMSPRLLTGQTKSLDGSDDDSLQIALRVADERDLKKFASEESPAWLQTRSSMPFDCTACGKCCKTVGSVYLSPDDVAEAARVLEVTVLHFISNYASHTISSTDDSASTDTQQWIRLEERTDAHGSPACVFLDLDTNFCQIYQARPMQCRTYPFWPHLVATPEAWNAECRRQDDDTDSQLPSWTAETGGCEGMARLSHKNQEKGAIPMDNVYRKLRDYVQQDRRFPKGRERAVKTEVPKTNVARNPTMK